MKLFARADRSEGEKYGEDTFLTVGKCVIDRYVVGSYIRIELPFTRVVEYVDCVTFRSMTGPCRPAWLRAKRTPNWSPDPLVRWTFAWIPVELEKHVAGTELGI